MVYDDVVRSEALSRSSPAGEFFDKESRKKHPLSQAFNTDPSLGMHQKNDLRLPGLHAVGNRNLGVLVTWVHIYKENLPKIVC